LVLLGWKVRPLAMDFGVLPFLITVLVLSCEASPKRGMAVQQDLYNCRDMDTLNVEWWWNWNTNKPCDAKEYVPQIWGRNNLPSLKSLPPGSDWVMAFDEPNNAYAGQDVMSPQEAASHWPEFEATGRKLVAPAPALGGTMSHIKWLDGFFGNCSKCRIDAVGIHTYLSDPNQVVSIVQDLYNRYKKPVWLTEVCYPSGNADQNTQFMNQLLPQLERLEACQRYAWVADRWTFDDVARGAALLPPNTNDFTLTQPGQSFVKY